MDVEITTALFRRVIEASKILGTDDDLRTHLSLALTKLLPLQIGRDGQLQEWRKDYEEAEPGHRHLSHLFAVFPSNEISPSTSDVYKAARVSLERRLAKGGGGTGWSRAWVVCLWATFGEGDKAEDSLRVLFTKSTWPNLFDLHPPGIFQIDGNLGATAGIAQMLLQSQNGTIELLPALPSAWKDGSVSGLRARGGLTVDMSWRNGRLRTASLRAANDGMFEVAMGPGAKVTRITLKAGQTRSLTVAAP
jgi:alpha-L-fucosidase 2